MDVFLLLLVSAGLLMVLWFALRFIFQNEGWGPRRERVSKRERRRINSVLEEIEKRLKESQ